ncbi:hypothetical protein SPHINGOR109_10976 [Sphingorhabdus sp. 109]|nr:hypothetical protein SPHINGOR109_10976 [Sphingorhabdus sp. 109]
MAAGPVMVSGKMMPNRWILTPRFCALMIDPIAAKAERIKGHGTASNAFGKNMGVLLERFDAFLWCRLQAASRSFPSGTQS